MRLLGKPGTNRLNIGAPITIPSSMRDRFDGPEQIGTGEVAPRNALRGTPLHKVDVRVQQEIRMVGSVRLQLVAEVFNLFNHDNFGSFVTQINNARFGEPDRNLRQRLRSALGATGIPLLVLTPEGQSRGYREVNLVIGDDADVMRRGLRPLWAAAPSRRWRPASALQAVSTRRYPAS